MEFIVDIVGRQNRILALDPEVISRVTTSVLYICECENPNIAIATAIVWDYTDNNEVLILTNYHTWNVEEYSYCFPPAHSAVPPKKSNTRTTKASNKQNTKKTTKKRKKDESEDENVQDPIQLVLRSDVGFNYQFTLTSDLFSCWSSVEDFAVLKLPSHHFHMPRIPIAGNLDASNEKNFQHQSYAYKFDLVMLVTNRKITPTNSPVKVQGNS